MDFKIDNQLEEFRQEINDFLEHQPVEDIVLELEAGKGPGPHSRRFWKELGKKGWLSPTLPKEYGGLGGNQWQRFVLIDELSYRQVVPDMLPGAQIVAPTLLLFGSDDQKRTLVPEIVRGDIEFALGYTEPEAGSDLTSVQTGAVEQGDRFIINGQKRFTSYAHFADYVWLLARTDPDVANKHRGLSLFMVKMNTPGITVQPVWIMDGVRTNEVFFDDVSVSRDSLVGEMNRGFYYLITSLAFERVYAVGWTRRIFDDIVEYVKTTGRGAEPEIKQSIGQLAAELEAVYLLSYRVIWLMENGQVPQWEASVLKVYWTEFICHMTDFGAQVLGPYSQIRGGLSDYPYGQFPEGAKLAPLQGKMEWLLRYAPRRRIGGGSVEILRNTIARYGLGLPRI